MRARIELTNETEFSPDFDLLRTAEEVAEKVLTEEGCPTDCMIELLITDPETVRELNREYRSIDRTTDVLSFPNLTWNAPAAFADEALFREWNLDPESGALLLGQIVLNAERVVSQAEEYGHSVKREYAFLIAHSLLHLLGYDHETEEEAAAMEEKQRRYLEALGITR